MLEPEDVQMIRETRKQITKMREFPMMLIRQVTGTKKDPLTGEYITTTERVDVVGTFRRITSGGAGSDDIVMVNGIVAEAGDAIVDLPFKYDVTGATHLDIHDERWRIRAMDPVGLGGPNRYYILVRRVT